MLCVRSFNVLFRHGRYMYLLVTDQGYLSEPGVVWERLDAIDGDTQMCGPDFQRYTGRGPIGRGCTSTGTHCRCVIAVLPGYMTGLDEGFNQLLTEYQVCVHGAHVPGACIFDTAGGRSMQWSDIRSRRAATSV